MFFNTKYFKTLFGHRRHITSMECGNEWGINTVDYNYSTGGGISIRYLKKLSTVIST